MDDLHFEPLTPEDIEDFECMDLENLDLESLLDLLDKAEDLMDEMYNLEPVDMGEEAHDIWDMQLSEVEDFIDRIREQMDRIGED